jgi:DNA-directed RNA polymerase specialized sigma24 family protein
VRRLEPLLRRVVRMRLADPGLRRVFDSMDIYRSVLAKFLARDARGAFDLSTPEQLEKLLVKMALDKLTHRARHERRNAGALPEGWEPAAADPTPSHVAAQPEEAQLILQRLSAKERWLAEQRALGRTWQEIAPESCDSAAAVRMMHARAIARVRRELQAEG